MAFRALVKSGDYNGFMRDSRLVLEVFNERYRFLEVEQSGVDFQNRTSNLAKQFTRLLESRMEVARGLLGALELGSLLLP